jgi:hypothetical protein
MTRFFKYFSGIRFKDRHLHIASTGAVIAIDKAFRHSAVSVLKIFAYFKARQIKHIFSRPKPKGTLAFYPQTPGPWYNIWQVAHLAGLKITNDISTVDYTFIFEDKTFSEYDKNFAEGSDTVLLNHHIDDISKDHVADVFEAVFGYALRIDPTTFEGRAIRKSNGNGTHDGVVMDFPIAPDEVDVEQTYQRLIDSTFNGNTAEDLRVAYVLGEIALVYHKRKPINDRFGTHYLSVDIKSAEAVFSIEEVDLIILFCKKMGLDFGAVDVMRDKHNGKIYIVDVNKTCMPVLSLGLKAQIAAQKIIAEMFVRQLGQK